MAVDKIEETLVVHREHGSERDLRILEAIVASIPAKARDILNVSKHGLVTAELRLYDFLIKYGAEPIQAAQCAVGYPDTHYFLRANFEGYDCYKRLRDPKEHPLATLLKVAESMKDNMSFSSVTREEYLRRLGIFRQTVAQILDEK